MQFDGKRVETGVGFPSDMKRLEPFLKLPPKTRRSILVKYTLYQIPDTALAFLVLWILVEWADVAPWIAGSLAILWILKDILMFPVLWHSFGGTDASYPLSLVGAEGIVTERCDPNGYVQVRGETWKAESDERGTVIDAGVFIVVTGSRGLTLDVKPRD